MKIQTVETDSDILKCWRAMKELRPHLKEEEFPALIRNMINEGYRLAFIEGENGYASSVIGFRYLQFTFNGKHFYIDDLSTLPEARGKGYAGALLDYVSELAKENGYAYVTLDSGFQRIDAHRLYLNKKFTIGSFHFVRRINS